jgi:hypothetical protein
MKTLQIILRPAVRRDDARSQAQTNICQDLLTARLARLVSACRAMSVMVYAIPWQWVRVMIIVW